MKKMIFSLLITVSLLALTSCDFESVFGYSSDAGLKFTLSEDGKSYSVCGTPLTRGDIVIPSTYRGLPVTEISQTAFYDCDDLTSVAIPESVTAIGAGAFSNCDDLTGVHITDIAAWCNIDFCYGANPLNCAKNLYLKGELITDLVIPDGVAVIGNYAFENLDSLESITVGDSVTGIGECAFFDCDNLVELVVPDSVTAIGDYSFYGCDSLTSVEIPDSVTRIGSSAFYSCNSLVSIVVPDSVTSIGKDAFSGCKNLQYNKYDNAYYLGSYNNPYIVLVKAKSQDITSCTIHEDTKYIYSSAFANCDSLISIEAHDSVAVIDESAFYDCDSLVDVKIGDNVTLIGSYAFYGCDSITSVSVGDGVTMIGSYAFFSCSSLASIKYCGTEDGWNAITKGSNWDHNAGRFCGGYKLSCNYSG